MKYAKGLDEVPIYDAPKGAPPRSVAVMIEGEDDKMLSMGFFSVPAGKNSEPDYHDVDEAYYITKGEGCGLLWVHGNDKEPIRYEVRSGTSVFIPAKVKHQMFNTGKEDIWLVWFFPRRAKVSGKLQSLPFTPKTWVKRSLKMTNEWYPKS